MPAVRRNTPLWRRVILILFVMLVTHATRAQAAQVALAWDAVADPDVVGYVVEYGTAAAPYSASVNVGNVTTWTFTSAVAGATYTFRVRAFNVNGMQSDPSNEVTATIPSDGTTTSSCATPDPFVAMGGGTCWEGNWLPPGMPIPGSTTTTTAPAPAPSSSTGCATPDPFVAMGGGTCWQGNWLPPGMPIPGGATTTAPTPTPYAPAPTPAPVYAPTGCATPDPFTAMGGGTCYNGNWFPPGMTIPGGATSSSTTQWSAPAPVNLAGCATPDPFVAIPTLVGLCSNGNWLPISGQAGTVHADATGAWQIVGDDGVTYAPTTSLSEPMQVEGQRLFFAGIPGTSTNGVTTIQILKIYAL